MKAKILSVSEVSLVFILMIGLFRLVTSLPAAAKVSGALNGFLFPGYAALLVAASALYIFRLRQLPPNLSAQKLEYQLAIAASGFFPMLVLSALLSWIDWRQWPGAVLISISEIALLLWLARMLRDKPSKQNVAVLGSFLLFPAAAQISAKLGGVAVAILYFYLFVAFSEETLFRGYIQSRLNAAFGRPRQFMGVSWGWGLVISAVLFGLWHLGWQPGALDLPHVLWTIFAGLIFGFVREKSDSIFAPALLHGIMNYGPQAALFYLFWSQ